jgi:hypothetical protein
VAFESAFSSKTSIEQNSDFSVSVSENERKVHIQQNKLKSLKTLV